VNVLLSVLSRAVEAASGQKANWDVVVLRQMKSEITVYMTFNSMYGVSRLILLATLAMCIEHLHLTLYTCCSRVIRTKHCRKGDCRFFQ